MQRMAPFMVMPVQEADKRNGNPAVNKQRVQQKIQPRFKRSAYFPKYNYREHILPDTNQRPYLNRQNGIKHVCIERIVHINIAANYIKSRKQQKVRLEQMQDAVQHNRVALFNAFFKQLADITAAYVKLALSPAFALIPGLHEGQRLFVVCPPESPSW